MLTHRVRGVAVSQRHIAEHFPHLAAEREALLEALLAFAEQHLERFPEPDFAADVYVAASGRARPVPSSFALKYPIAKLYHKQNIPSVYLSRVYGPCMLPCLWA